MVKVLEAAAEDHGGDGKEWEFDPFLERQLRIVRREAEKRLITRKPGPKKANTDFTDKTR
jgi:hypothetical protein